MYYSYKNMRNLGGFFLVVGYFTNLSSFYDGKFLLGTAHLGKK
jgi:hypothetical protein